MAELFSRKDFAQLLSLVREVERPLEWLGEQFVSTFVHRDHFIARSSLAALLRFPVAPRGQSLPLAIEERLAALFIVWGDAVNGKSAFLPLMVDLLQTASLDCEKDFVAQLLLGAKTHVRLLLQRGGLTGILFILNSDLIIILAHFLAVEVVAVTVCAPVQPGTAVTHARHRETYEQLH